MPANNIWSNSRSADGVELMRVFKAASLAVALGATDRDSRSCGADELLFESHILERRGAKPRAGRLTFQKTKDGQRHRRFVPVWLFLGVLQRDKSFGADAGSR